MKIIDRDISLKEYEELRKMEVYRRYILRDNFDLTLIFLANGKIILNIVDFVAGRLEKRYIELGVEDE